MPLIDCASSQSTKVTRHSVKGNVSNRQIVTPHKGLLGPRCPRHSGRCPAGNYLPRRAARDGVIRFLCAYLERGSSISSRKRALPPGGHPLRNAVLDSTMGQMRVEAAFAAIHAI